jgi:hypothetical protein
VVLQVEEVDHALDLLAVGDARPGARRREEQVVQKPVRRCVWRPISRFCSTLACSNSSMFWKVRAMPSAATSCGGLGGELDPVEVDAPRWACRCG